jgi:hypothetical protein
MAVIFGPLPQALRRVMRGLPLFAALPGPEKLAALSLEFPFGHMTCPPKTGRSEV